MVTTDDGAPYNQWKGSFGPVGEHNSAHKRGQSFSQKRSFLAENEAEQEDLELIESEIARFTEEMYEKEQLPILIRQALKSGKGSGYDSHELIIDQVERQISDF